MDTKTRNLDCLYHFHMADGVLTMTDRDFTRAYHGVEWDMDHIVHSTWCTQEHAPVFTHWTLTDPRPVPEAEPAPF